MPVTAFTIVCIMNTFSILILTGAWVGGRSVLGLRSRTDVRVLRYLFAVVFVASILDTIVLIFDGNPKIYMVILNTIGSTLLFMAGIGISVGWPMFIRIHLHGVSAENDSNLRFLLAVATTISVTVIINIFLPIYFYIDDNNVYHRLPGYHVFIAYIAVCVLGSILDYYIYAGKNRNARFFDMAMYLLPPAVACIIQQLVPEASVIWCALSISLVGCVICLQSESAYLDQLTGILNRTYLFSTFHLHEYKNMHGGIMVDLNSFKQINDAYGHEEGDAALQNVAEILKCAVNGCGVVIRYGGDEFLIFTREYSDSVQKNIIN